MYSVVPILYIQSHMVFEMVRQFAYNLMIFILVLCTFFLAFVCHFKRGLNISMEFYCYILFVPFFFSLIHTQTKCFICIIMIHLHRSILLWKSRITQWLRHTVRVLKITLTEASVENPWFKWQWNSKEAYPII